jgi:hypothetical protein
MSVCWDCDRLVSGMYGHQSGCSNPQQHEEHAELPGPFRYDLRLSCEHHVFLSSKIPIGSWVGAWITCWQGMREPWRCQAQRRVVGVTVVTKKKSSGSPPDRVALPAATGYTGRLPKVKNSSRPKEREMARGRAAAAPVEEVEVEEAEDYTVYATKTITATMDDFATWIVDEVYGGDEAAFKKASSERIVSLAGTLRMKFQASDFNIEQREARKLEREAARAEVAVEPEDEAPAPKPKRGRAAATEAPAPAAAPKRGRAAAAPAAAPAKPARRGRVAASAAAPY